MSQDRAALTGNAFNPKLDPVLTAFEKSRAQSMSEIIQFAIAREPDSFAKLIVRLKTGGQGDINAAKNKFDELIKKIPAKDAFKKSSTGNDIAKFREEVQWMDDSEAKKYLLTALLNMTKAAPKPTKLTSNEYLFMGIYEYGQGDQWQARDYFEKAGEENPHAQYCLGYLELNPYMLAASHDQKVRQRALQYYSKAADKGHPYALAALAKSKSNEVDSTFSANNSVAYPDQLLCILSRLDINIMDLGAGADAVIHLEDTYCEAAKAGLPLALYFLGSINWQRSHNTNNTLEQQRAWSYLNEASNKNVAQASNKIAQIYRFKMKKLGKAAEFYRRGAEQGSDLQGGIFTEVYNQGNYDVMDEDTAAAFYHSTIGECLRHAPHYYFLFDPNMKNVFKELATLNLTTFHALCDTHSFQSWVSIKPVITYLLGEKLAKNVYEDYVVKMALHRVGAQSLLGHLSEEIADIVLSYTDRDSDIDSDQLAKINNLRTEASSLLADLSRVKATVLSIFAAEISVKGEQAINLIDFINQLIAELESFCGSKTIENLQNATRLMEEKFSQLHEVMTMSSGPLPAYTFFKMQGSPSLAELPNVLTILEKIKNTFATWDLDASPALNKKR